MSGILDLGTTEMLRNFEIWEFSKCREVSTLGNTQNIGKYFESGITEMLGCPESRNAASRGISQISGSLENREYQRYREFPKLSKFFESWGFPKCQNVSRVGNSRNVHTSQQFPEMSVSRVGN